MNAFRRSGLSLGKLPSGPRATITDVPGVRVGHYTLIDEVKGNAIRTGVTAVVPPGDPYAEPLAAGIFVLHGHGKAVGLWQIQDLGELETPILLTNTLAVFSCAEALLTWTLQRHPQARSINPVVLECNDGWLSTIELRPLRAEHGLYALDVAGEEVAEGCVGAGTGMMAFGYKSGIGTASRIVDGYTLGALVLPNMGRPEDFICPFSPGGEGESEGVGGSLIVVLATDAPLLPAQLARLCRRAALGAARTGAPADTGSGDFFLAFSTALRFPRDAKKAVAEIIPERSRLMSQFYRAAAEVTEEAIYSALIAAAPLVGREGRTPPVFRPKNR